jgi:hypothetical protein
MSQQHPITPPPPHLLKKFSAQAQAEANKRNGTGYLKTVATLCIEWFVNSQSTSNDRQIRSSEIEPPRELVEQWEEQSGLKGQRNKAFLTYNRHPSRPMGRRPWSWRRVVSGWNTATMIIRR